MRGWGGMLLCKGLTVGSVRCLGERCFVNALQSPLSASSITLSQLMQEVVSTGVMRLIQQMRNLAFKRLSQPHLSVSESRDRIGTQVRLASVLVWCHLLTHLSQVTTSMGNETKGRRGSVVTFCVWGLLLQTCPPSLW